MTPWRCTCRNEEATFIESENGIHSTKHRKSTRTATYNVPIHRIRTCMILLVTFYSVSHVSELSHGGADTQDTYLHDTARNLLFSIARIGVIARGCRYTGYVPA